MSQGSWFKASYWLVLLLNVKFVTGYPKIITAINKSRNLGFYNKSPEPSTSMPQRRRWPLDIWLFLLLSIKQISPAVKRTTKNPEYQ